MTGPVSAPRKPVILTVDDDPAVSRAVARDLRRHYGERYRIVRAESGPDALETLNELKLRGDTVAVFVADYRMPQMSGIEFLEEAMDIYPLARRVLLTASAEGEALPGARRSARGMASHGRPRDSAHQGDRPPLERAVLGGASVPGPQSALVPLVHGRRGQGQAVVGRGRPRRLPTARGHHRTGRDPRRPDGRRVGRH